MDDYYQSHWREIEEERLQRYEQMFQWRPEMEPIMTRLNLEADMKVLDYGCGPGFLAAEIARRVGGAGQVIGLDINEAFVERASQRSREEQLSQLHFKVLQSDHFPVEADSVDRVICKNVLEYVPHVQQVIDEIKRVLKPGGLVLLMDSDWGFLVVEPWGKIHCDDFFSAASGAFKEPYIGRKLPGLLHGAGFVDIDLQVNNMVDSKGSAISVLQNMAAYIRVMKTMDTQVLASRMQQLETAIDKGEYLFVLPQFSAIAKRPGR